MFGSGSKPPPTMADSVGLLSVASAVAGVMSWFIYFHRFEVHMNGLMYINIFILGCVGSTVYLAQSGGLPVLAAATTTASLASAYLFGAFGSMLFWRAFLNPLNKFPGPWAARLGNLYMSWNFRNSDAYYKLQAMHKKWGNIVRIGSNDLSIIDAGIMEEAYGRNSRVTKGWWYDNDAPLSSMHTTRDKALHDARRKVWVPAFSEKAIRDYETRIAGYEDTVVEKFAEAKGKPMDVRLWFNLFSFDVMALLAFGKNYGMLDRGEKHWALELLDEGMQPLAYFFPAWFFKLMTKIPGAAAGYTKFVKFCVDELTVRVENAKQVEKEGKTDIMSSILKAYQNISRPEKDPMLQADCRLIIVAGSDTTATTFTWLFYHLAQHSDDVEKLREELQPLCQGEWSDKDIARAPHLNGCINEALRLHPPVMSGVQRLTPREGLKVGDEFVPGNTIFYMPQFVMGRDETNYADADSFIPERWYDKDEMIKQKDAFAPFSMGPMGCIGKNLALMELRTLTAKLILKFNVALAPGEDGKRVLHATRDHFTQDPGSLDLVFESL